MISANEYKRICWASRRGMLELDLMLVPFVENQFPQLSESDQQCYMQLMEGEDTELFAWFLARQTPDDPALAGIVEQIITYSRAHKP